MFRMIDINVMQKLRKKTSRAEKYSASSDESHEVNSLEVRRREKEAIKKLVVNEGLFFPDWYLMVNDDIKAAGVDPTEHYINYGAFENRNPNPFFDSDFYYNKNLKNTGVKNNSPMIIHYIRHGHDLNYDIHPLIKESEIKAESQSPGLMELVSKVSLEQPQGMGRNELLDRLDKKIIKNPRRMNAFLVFGDDAISGGIFSIFSLVDEHINNGISSQLYSMPHENPVIKYSRFSNDKTILPFSYLEKHIKENKIAKIQVPEVLFEAAVDKVGCLEVSDIEINILNQNEEYMPDTALIKEAKKIFSDVTMTTAHLKYSTQEHSNKYGLPIKHLSTYMSHDDYEKVRFKDKENRVLLSPDRKGDDDVILSHLTSGFLGYDLYRIENLHFDIYKHTVKRSKYMITLGEGLDNYFIETFFCGGVAFTVYNDTFMPKELRDFPNVFLDIHDMKRKLPSLISKLEFNEAFREEVIEMNHSFLAKIYDGEIYRSKVKSFINGDFDYTPEGCY